MATRLTCAECAYAGANAAQMRRHWWGLHAEATREEHAAAEAFFSGRSRAVPSADVLERVTADVCKNPVMYISCRTNTVN
jgi:hypothetical protein